MKTTTDIDPQLVKALREKTNAGMMDCKRALAESGGDLEKAETILRFGFLERSGGNLLSRKLYRHYHRQDCV